MYELEPFITAFTTAVAVLAGFWVYRKTGRLDTIHFVFGIGVICYTCYHYYAVSLGFSDPVHTVVSGLFNGSVAITNAYCSTCRDYVGKIKIGVDRRTKESNGINYGRRKTTSQAVITNPILCKDAAK